MPFLDQSKVKEKARKWNCPSIKSHININLHRPITGTIKSATITKTSSGKYFASILCAWTCTACGAEHDRDINAAMNIKNTGQWDLYDKTISDAIADMGVIPVALQKMTSKIERSDICLSVGHGSGQAARSLVVQ